VEVELVLTSEYLPAAQSGNVVAEIKGRTRPDEVVVIGAHLDSWDLGTGALDDGAGVGVVVGAAKALMDAMPEGPERTLRVVLFGAEEVGLVGAKAYAQKHQADLEKIVLAFESDFGAGDIWRLDHGVTDEALPVIKGMTSMLAPWGLIPGKPGATGGPDISVLAKAGVPVITPLQNGWDYFDYHHTPDDTFDKLQRHSLDQNVGVYAAILSVALREGVYFK
jgi:carboxypeptidase Q